MKKIHLKSIDSTNLFAKRELKGFPKDQLTLIIADIQTRGRGQFEREWISPKGNLYMTSVRFLPDYPKDLTKIPLKFARNIQKWLLQYGVQAKIKWPNDLMVNQKKIAGILCETAWFEGELAIILGVGLNVNMTTEEASKIDQAATSLKIETGQSFDLSQIVDDFPLPEL
ncbi:MAG: biotin--[acetyl-CoA-carboxylase] ligase [Waddliaceae bacterium]